MQEIWSGSLIQDYPTFHGGTKPVSWALDRASAPQQEKPLQWEAQAPQLESNLHPSQQKWRPSTAKNK